MNKKYKVLRDLVKAIRVNNNNMQLNQLSNNK